MQDSEDFSLKEGPGSSRDQVDGSGVSLGQRKGVKVSGKYSAPPSDWDRGGREGGPSIIHSSYANSNISRLSDNPPTIISIGPHTRKVGAPDRNPPRVHPEGPPRVEWTREGPSSTSYATTSYPTRPPTTTSDTGVSRQTMDELKSILRESSMLGGGGSGGAPRGREEAARPGGGQYSYPHHGHSPGGAYGAEGRQDEGLGPHRSFSTFRPNADGTRRATRSRDSSSMQLMGSSMDSTSSYREQPPSRLSGARSPTLENSSHWTDTSPSQTDNSKDHIDPGTRAFSVAMARIKQEVGRENISFVRFEATDLHGVSRSKTVPVRFFNEKAIYGVPMPRSYLELTLNLKGSEVDHGSNPASFNSDILLLPDLDTFRLLPWAEGTARVICDPCTVSGSPLRTSPRIMAKLLLGQLQSLGFSFHSSFTYECCVLGTPDRVGPKTLMFPATTLLSNHDQPFFQQLVEGMYGLGADVDSFSSASGPGQMEVVLRPEFGIAAADAAFTFRTGIKELARKHSYVASFFTDDGLYNAGVLSHCLWDANGRRSLFHAGGGGGGSGGERELSEIGRKWLSGLLSHAAALSCLMAPGVGCRSHIAASVKQPRSSVYYATYGCNDNSSAFNVKSHGGRETHIDNKLGSAVANPYVVLAATVAAGLDGIRRNLAAETGLTRGSTQQKLFAIPVKLEDALGALEEDHVIRGALGEPFVQYFIAMKRFEIETQELDEERNKCLEYFI